MERSPVDDVLLETKRPYHINIVYHSEESLASSAGSFLHATVVRGGAAIAIASAPHLAALEKNLSCHGLDLADLRRQGRYFPLYADLLYEQFTDRGKFREELLMPFVSDLLERANSDTCPVGLYGDIVVLLTQRQDFDAAARLEDLWALLLEEKPHAAVCGYPGSAFGGPAHRRNLRALCDRHEHTIGYGA